jgi:hypothetical protein
MMPRHPRTPSSFFSEQAATLVHHGKTHSLGRFSPAASTPALHVFDGGDTAENDAAGQPLFYRALVS